MTPPYMFFEPGNGPRSSRHTVLPARAITIAAALPAGPAPTTMTSKSNPNTRSGEASAPDVEVVVVDSDIVVLLPRGHEGVGGGEAVGRRVHGRIEGLVRSLGHAEAPAQLGDERRRVGDHGEV